MNNKPTTQHRVFIGSVVAVLVAVTQKVRTGAVSIVALKLAEPAVASGTGGGLVGAVPAVRLTVAFPPNRNAAVEAEVSIIQTVQ